MMGFGQLTRVFPVTINQISSSGCDVIRYWIRGGCSLPLGYVSSKNRSLCVGDSVGKLDSSGLIRVICSDIMIRVDQYRIESFLAFMFQTKI